MNLSMDKAICSAAIIALMTMSVTSCNKQAPKVDEKPTTTSTSNTDMKIAYIEVDSIMSQYKFCKEYSQILDKKSQNIQNTINSKGRSLQNAVAKFQQDIQNNKYTQQQAEAVQAGLQKQDADLRELQQRLGTEFQAETEKFNKALRDSIQHFLAAYNKDKKFSLILSKAGDNILYAGKAYDITDEVITGLNKAYKPTTKKK